MSDATYYLSIAVNGQNDNQIVPVVYRNNSYFVEAGILAGKRVHLNGQTQGLVNVGTLPEVKVNYDAASQQLLLTVPDSWLPQQNIGETHASGYSPAQSGTGLLLNYDAWYTDPHQGPRSLATWTEQRLFSNAGIFTNTGTLRYSENSASQEQYALQKGYIRYDTFWRYSDEENALSYQIGDFVSDSLTWSNSARMGGLRISRNFSVRPDLVTYPLLQYSGTAAVPSTVDLFLNGYKVSSNQLNSGPFTLTNVPYINGEGEATIVTTDALGRQVSTSVPFYVSNTLLRQGLTDFDVSLGTLRRNYGIDSGNYSDVAFSGLYRYGLTNRLTLSTHGETTQGLVLGGVGADFAVGHWGTFSLSGSQSRADHGPVYQPGYHRFPSGNLPVHDGDPITTPSRPESASDEKSGNQYTVGYSWYARRFNLAVLRSSRTAGYQDLSSYTSDTRLSRQADQATLSTTPFGTGNGTVGVGYYDVEAYDNTHTRLMNLSYSRSLWGQSSMFLSLNKTLSDNGYSAQLQFILPLSSGANISTGVQRNNAGDYQTQIGTSKSAPTDGGLGWNVAYRAGHNPYQQADATWRSRYATLQGGLYGESGNYTQWADLSGSIIAMDNDLFLSDKINDAFILVDTGNYADVPVKYENQPFGKTDKNGHLLVPTVSSYYPAKIEIDTMSLPADVMASRVSDHVAVREGSGALISFPVKRMLSANVTIYDARQQPLKLGTPVTEKNSHQTSIVGYDGLVYFTNLQQHNVLMIQQDDHSICHIGFDLSLDHHSIEQVGPLVCRPDEGPKEREGK
ncbi:fimbrial assembly protein [[Pantoea] beijingensis]|uniref:Fimbrial assembly protein n=2 Tax=[Pantoea] beijingensis TaxID=1324864 RepID=A0A443IDP6_9GAMM|nr:fimbrial assembly protein [[Pantoea] beijingensis]